MADAKVIPLRKPADRTPEAAADEPRPGEAGAGSTRTGKARGGRARTGEPRAARPGAAAAPDPRSDPTALAAIRAAGEPPAPDDGEPAAGEPAARPAATPHPRSDPGATAGGEPAARTEPDPEPEPEPVTDRAADPDPDRAADPDPEPSHAEPPAALEALTEALAAVADRMMGGPWERKVAGGLAFLRRRVTGEYEVDDFGYDADLTEQALLPLVRPLYEKYFRVDVRGVEHIPSEGGALVVANHSGALPLDAVMTQVAVHDHHPAGRHLRLLAADLVFMLPVVNELARKAGHTLACTEDAQLLLERGEIVGVMPEGFKGLGKPFSERYKLQRFGRGGFVATALRTGRPIVPCSVVGAEEIYPMVGNAKTLARLLGLPYFPVTPTFPWLGPVGMIPLPTKWTIEFGEPIPTDGYPPEAADDPMLVFNLADQVRETIQHTLYKLLVQRRSVFF
jgi:1-acyl-sn-glycerol-3-phosphate acyltransferase